MMYRTCAPPDGYRLAAHSRLTPLADLPHALPEKRYTAAKTQMQARNYNVALHPLRVLCDGYLILDPCVGRKGAWRLACDLDEVVDDPVERLHRE